MKGILSVATLSAVLFLAAGCTQSLRVHPKTPNESVLYVVRGDAALSGRDTMKVFLNGKESATLTYDSYKVLHVKPGMYEIEFKAGSADNLKSALKFSENIPPNSIKFSSVAYNFGWRGPDKLMDGKDVVLFSKFEFKGEVDMTKTVLPR